MPSYKVLKDGFFHGRLYTPDGKRNVLHTDEPFPKGKLPKWLEAIPEETAAEKKKRLAAEKKASAAEKKKAEDDKKDIESASFLAAESGAVETL